MEKELEKEIKAVKIKAAIRTALCIAVIGLLFFLLFKLPKMSEYKNACTQQTSGTIKQIEGDYIFVDYAVGGAKYRIKSSKKKDDKTGDSITVMYNPSDPAQGYARKPLNKDSNLMFVVFLGAAGIWAFFGKNKTEKNNMRKGGINVYGEDEGE